MGGTYRAVATRTSLVLSLALPITGGALQAEVALDGTMGPAGALPGPDYVISDDLGQTVGDNLFHSFGAFNINSPESATFTGPDNIDNIIGRVTGGAPSTIDGYLESTIPGADLYLINPAGLIFGENAVLDVQGSFHASTANYIGFPDGGRFDASNTSNTVLTSAPPVAFGFLDANPAPISITGSYIFAPDSENITLVGGDITIDRGMSYDPLLTAPGGQINIDSVASSGEADISGRIVDTDGFTSLGNLSIGGAEINVDEAFGVTGGGVFIRAGRLTLEHSTISNTALVNNNNAVDIQADDSISITDSSATLSNVLGTSSALILQAGNDISMDNSNIIGTTFGAGAGPDIRFDAATLQMSSSVIASEVEGLGFFGAGIGGDVRITANTVSLDASLIHTITSVDGGSGGDLFVVTGTALDDGSIALSNRSDITTFGTSMNDGLAGDVYIETGILSIEGSSSLGSTTFFDCGGICESANLPGDVFITAHDTLTMSSTDPAARSAISSLSTSTRGSGDVSISTSTLRMDGGHIALSNEGSGGPGIFFVDADTVGLSNGATISTATTSAGPGAPLVITARDSITLSGGAKVVSFTNTLDPAFADTATSGFLSISTPVLIVEAGAQLASFSSGVGDAGVVRVSASDPMGSDLIPSELVRLDGGSISTSAHGDGDAGLVDIRGQTIEILNEGFIDSSTFGGLGRGGLVSVNGGELRVSGVLSLVSSITATPAPAGEVWVYVDRLILEDGGRISCETLMGGGDAGTLRITANESFSISSPSISSPTIDPSFFSGLMTNTYGTGAGGDVLIDTPSLVMNGGMIQAISGGTGRAGNILTNTGNLSLSQGGSISASTFDAGTGGVVLMDVTGSISIDGTDATGFPSGIYTFASGIADSGSIFISAPQIVLSDGGTINAASAGSGTAGNISVTASELSLANAEVSTTATTTGAGGSIGLEVDGSMSLRLIDTRISAEVNDVPDGTDPSVGTANITLTALAVEMTGESEVTARTTGARDAGAIVLEAATVDLTGAQLTSSSAQGATGAAGDLIIAGSDGGSAQRVQLTDGASLTSTAVEGEAGSVAVTADELMLRDATVSTTVAGTSPGDRGGDVTLTATSVMMEGASRVEAETTGGANADVVQLKVGTLEVAGASSVSTNSTQTGAAGDVIIEGLDGDGAQRVRMTDGASLTSTAVEGEAGSVTVNAEELILQDATVSTTVGGTSPGERGGSVELTALQFSMNGGVVEAESTGTSDAGNVIMDLGSLSTQGGSIVSRSTSQAGNAGAGGAIEISAMDIITLSGTDVLATVLGGEQPGGDVTLSAPEIRLINGTAVAAESEGTGTAGAIAIGDAGTASLRLQNSTVSTNAAEAKGGDINLQAQEIVYLTDSAITTSVGAGEGQGGNIFIDPQYVILNASRVQANAVGGPGGRIEIFSDIFIASADSVVEAVSETNIQGVILISAPERDVVSGASVLPAEFQDPSRRLRARCGQRVDVGRSNFQVVGQEGLPPSPDDYLWVTPLLPVAAAGGELGSVVFSEPAATQFSATPCGQNCVFKMPGQRLVVTASDLPV